MNARSRPRRSPLRRDASAAAGLSSGRGCGEDGGAPRPGHPAKRGCDKWPNSLNHWLKRPTGASHKLRRDVGLVGLVLASVGSIIGAGWLFAAFYAASLAGPAAIISWLIGGSAMMLLALTHAELGAAYPVAAGNARFPHFASAG